MNIDNAPPNTDKHTTGFTETQFFSETHLMTRFHSSALGEIESQRKPAESVGVSSSVLLFDACHAGVVLRVVVFIELMVAVNALFVSHSLYGWFMHVSVWTAGALPAGLLWLVVACAIKQVLAKIALWLQCCVGLAMGLLCGWMGVYGLSYLGLISEVPLVAGAGSGMLGAVLLMSDLYSRARRREPTMDKARLAELQSRIRPHFLFNTLNSAIALIRESPRQAERVLEDLSELFRHVLKDHREASTLGQELELAQRYLEIEKVRFGDRLRLHWKVDESAHDAKIPPLVLQPLVENTIRHGVEPSASGADVWVSTERRGSVVYIRVRNTLPNGPGPSGNGLALANVRERLYLLHDVQSSFRSGMLTSEVHEVRIRLPLNSVPLASNQEKTPQRKRKKRAK